MNCCEVVLLKRYKHVKSENMLFLHSAILIDSSLSCGLGLLELSCCLVNTEQVFLNSHGYIVNTCHHSLTLHGHVTIDS